MNSSTSIVTNPITIQFKPTKKGVLASYNQLHLKSGRSPTSLKTAIKLSNNRLRSAVERGGAVKVKNILY